LKKYLNLKAFVDTKNVKIYEKEKKLSNKLIAVVSGLGPDWDKEELI
jgi:hypothetical protein